MGSPASDQEIRWHFTIESHCAIEKLLPCTYAPDRDIIE